MIKHLFKVTVSRRRELQATQLATQDDINTLFYSFELYINFQYFIKFFN